MAPEATRPDVSVNWSTDYISLNRPAPTVVQDNDYIILDYGLDGWKDVVFEIRPVILHGAFADIDVNGPVMRVTQDGAYDLTTLPRSRQYWVAVTATGKDCRRYTIAQAIESGYSVDATTVFGFLLGR